MKKNTKENIANILALTPTQEGMLFHYLKEPGSQLYFEQLTLELSGKVENTLFEKAWNTVIQTNEMLRTHFRWEKIKKPVQVIQKQHHIKPQYYKIPAIGERQQKIRLEEIAANDRKEGFDLQQVPFRITLCRTLCRTLSPTQSKHGESKYTLIISNHHILYDGWSTGIILKEFLKAYNGLARGNKIAMPIKTPFKDYIKWTQQKEIEKEQAFWKNYLNDIEPQAGLSIKRKKKRPQETVIKTRIARFDETLSKDVDTFVGQHKITPATVLYTAWGVLQQRYNNDEDVIFGTTVSGRNAGVKGIEEMVGLFINTIPLRVKTGIPTGVTGTAQQTIELLQQVEETLRHRQDYSGTSILKIKEYSGIDANKELFKIIVVIENYPLEKQLPRQKNQLSVKTYSMTEMTNYDITVGITLFEGIEINIAYDEKLYASNSIDRLTEHYKNIMQEIITHPQQPVSTLEMISEKEKAHLLYGFNDTRWDYPEEKTIHEIFEEQVEKTPDSISTIGSTQYAVGKEKIKDKTKSKKETIEEKEKAIRGKTSSIRHPASSIQLTYRELNRRANHLARHLQEKGFTPGTVAAMAVPPSVETVIAIMTIWKAGGSYLPIDLTLPDERVAYMLKDSNAKLLIKELHELHEL
ncbi:MAG: AMP-binding protein, partial [bacterium]|nr:AMP-binding protein [bacterium]